MPNIKPTLIFGMKVFDKGGRRLFTTIINTHGQKLVRYKLSDFIFIRNGHGYITENNVFIISYSLKKL